MSTVSPYDPNSAAFDFDHEVRELVVDTAPRMFAVVQEYDLKRNTRTRASPPGAWRTTTAART
ncbi:hypothetical protein B7755_027870 [Streptomyces sp. NBS 14/10]|uniref:hypothetical protein n=1 Tax=Streptomyces sp. NBS 14/10 TaxID=1945643 RepID=UPI00211B14B6|nr:hypothetical protein [Streptomyces sp. NBS 14/10]KAK1181625.1 hypothetical protein B7755_027870 [Streptomyces sp. NBS 14/10]